MSARRVVLALFVHSVLGCARSASDGAGATDAPAATVTAPTPSSSPASDTTSGAAAAGTQGGSQPASTGPATAATAPSPYLAKTDLAKTHTLRGRFDVSEPAAPLFEWENAAIGIRFRGSSKVSAKLTNVENRLQNNSLQVSVDGQEGKKIVFSPDTTQYVLASDLGAGEHTLWLSKVQEFGFGAVRFDGFVLDAGALLLAPPALPRRRVLFMGSSTLSGWGADGAIDPTLDCLDEVNYPATNAEHSIPRYTADLLVADYHNLSRGGAGVLVTFAPGVKTLSQTMSLALNKPPVAWDDAMWRADAVVLEAGGSDILHGDSQPPILPPGTIRGYPSAEATSVEQFTEAQYRAAWRQLVDRIRAAHPQAWVVLVDTKNQRGASAPLLFSIQDDLAADFAKNGDSKVVRFDYFKTPLSTPSPYKDWDALNAAPGMGQGCQDHPSPKAAQFMAGRLAEFLRSKLKWQ